MKDARLGFCALVAADVRAKAVWSTVAPRVGLVNTMFVPPFSKAAVALVSGLFWGDRMCP